MSSKPKRYSGSPDRELAIQRSINADYDAREGYDRQPHAVYMDYLDDHHPELYPFTQRMRHHLENDDNIWLPPVEYHYSTNHWFMPHPVVTNDTSPVHVGKHGAFNFYTQVVHWNNEDPDKRVVVLSAVPEHTRSRNSGFVYHTEFGHPHQVYDFADQIGGEIGENIKRNLAGSHEIPDTRPQQQQPQKNARRPSKVYRDQPSGASVHPKIRGTKFEGILRNLIATHTAGDPVHQFARSVLTHTPEASVHLHKALKDSGHPAAKHFEPKAKMQRTARKYAEGEQEPKPEYHVSRGGDQIEIFDHLTDALEKINHLSVQHQKNKYFKIFLKAKYPDKSNRYVGDSAYHSVVSDGVSGHPNHAEKSFKGNRVEIERLISHVHNRLFRNGMTSDRWGYLHGEGLTKTNPDVLSFLRSAEDLQSIVPFNGLADYLEENGHDPSEIRQLIDNHKHLYSRSRRYSAAESTNLTEGMNQAKFWLNDPMVNGKWSRFSNLVAQSPHLKGYLARNGNKQLFPTKQHFNDFYEFVNNATPEEHAKVLGNATGPEAISKWKEQRENEQIPLRLTVANPDQFNKLLYKDGKKPAQRTLFRPIDGPAPKVGNLAYFTDPDGNAFHIAKVADTKDSNGKRKIVLDMQNRDEHTPAEKASYDKGWMDAQTGKDLKSGAGDFWTDDQHALYNLGRQDWHNKRIHGSSAPGVRTPDWKASEADGENEHIKGLVHAGVTAYLSKLLPHSTNRFSSALLQQHPKAAALTDGIASEVLGIWQKALQRNPRLRERNLNNLIRNVVKRNITSNPTALHVGNLIDSDLDGYLKHTGGINTPEDIHEYRNDLFDRKGIDLSRDAVLEALHRLQMGKDYNSPLSGRDADTRNTSEIANDSAEKLRHLVDDGTNPLFDNPFHYQQAAKMIPMLQALSSPSEHRRMQRTARKYAAVGEQDVVQSPPISDTPTYVLRTHRSKRKGFKPQVFRFGSFVDMLKHIDDNKYRVGHEPVTISATVRYRDGSARDLSGPMSPVHVKSYGVNMPHENPQGEAVSNPMAASDQRRREIESVIGHIKDDFKLRSNFDVLERYPELWDHLRAIEGEQSTVPLAGISDFLEERGHNYPLAKKHVNTLYSRSRFPKKVQR